jgi:hypothetical protein
MFTDPELMNSLANLLMLGIAFGLVGIGGLWLARPARTVNPFVACGDRSKFKSGLTETLI